PGAKEMCQRGPSAPSHRGARGSRSAACRTSSAEGNAYRTAYRTASFSRSSVIWGAGGGSAVADVRAVMAHVTSPAPGAAPAGPRTSAYVDDRPSAFALPGEGATLCIERPDLRGLAPTGSAG